MLQGSLRRTRQAVFGRLVSLLGMSELDGTAWEQVEALLIQADIGIQTAAQIVSALQEKVAQKGITTRDGLNNALGEALAELLPSPKPLNLDPSNLLSVVLVVGVNGSGKTTATAKLAKRFSGEGWRVIAAAADTFRAAAAEQLQTWGQLLQIPVIVGSGGADPGAVVYDAIRAARARGCNLLLVDTAGRLHTKYNLMEELKKIHKVAAKNVHNAPHETWLVLDGTTGQNALSQAATFTQAVALTGVIVSKLDSSAKGGMVFAVGHDLGLPVRYLGVGEALDDMVPFDPKTFIEALLAY